MVTQFSIQELPKSFVPFFSRETVTTDRGVLDHDAPMTPMEAKGPKGYVLTFVSYRSVEAAISDARDATRWALKKGKGTKGKTSPWGVFLSTSTIRNPRTGQRGWLCTATVKNVKAEQLATERF